MYFPLEIHVSQCFDMLLWIVAYCAQVQVSKGQYSHVEAYREMQIGYPITHHSKSVEQLLVFTDMDIIYYMPKMKHCLEWGWYFKIPNGKGAMTTEIEYHCIYLGLSRFWWHNKRFWKDSTPFAFFAAKPRYMVTGSKENTISERMWSTTAMFYWNTSKKAPKVPWHYVAGTGPGWIDLRFAVPHSNPNGLYTYRIRHWRHSDGQDPQYAYETLVPNLFIDWKEIMPRVKPPLPCPQWKTYDIYCVLLTAHINPLHFSGKNYSDYTVQIFTIGIKPKMRYNVHNYTYNQIDTQLYGKESDPRTFTVRVWENCDTTSTGCPKILRSLPFHKEWTKEPVLKEIWGPNRTYEEDETTTRSHVMESGTERVEQRSQYSEMVSSKEFMNKYLHLWPLLLFLLLVILLVLLPLIFILNRRSYAQREMNKWFFWSREDDSIIYAVRRPTHLPPMDAEAPWISLEKGATLYQSDSRRQREHGRREPRRSQHRRTRTT